MQKKFLLHDLAPKSAEEEVGQPGARQELSQSTFQAVAHPRTCYPSLTGVGSYSGGVIWGANHSPVANPGVASLTNQRGVFSSDPSCRVIPAFRLFQSSRMSRNVPGLGLWWLVGK